MWPLGLSYPFHATVLFLCSLKTSWGFLMYFGGMEKDKWYEIMKWVNLFRSNGSLLFQHIRVVWSNCCSRLETKAAFTCWSTMENTRTMSEIRSKLTIKTSERQWCRSCVFIVDFELISHIVLVFPLMTLNKEMPTGKSWNIRERWCKIFLGSQREVKKAFYLNSRMKSRFKLRNSNTKIGTNLVSEWTMTLPERCYYCR